MKELNILLIGDGNIGSIHKRIITESETINLVGIVDKKYKNSSKNGILYFNDIKEIDFNKLTLDGVIVATPTKSHYQISKKIIENKIPVLVEKPVTTNISNLKKLIELAKKNNTVFRAGLIETCNPIFSYLKDNINIDEFELIHIKRHSPKPSDGRELEDVLFDLSIHDISVLYSLFGFKKIELVSISTIKKNGIIETADMMLKIGKKNIFISSSRQSQLKIRSWSLQSSSELFEINLIEKKLDIFKTGGIKFTNSKPSYETYKSQMSFIDYQETAQIQFDLFINNIKSKKIDKDHIKLIHQSHNFISELSKNV
mgnify:FL=1|jgi:predicted dehydrogenase|tara:strand:- start:420 stop:1361 length:942 start_codon:yes stop_codon:yes gene_type:complete